MAINKVEANGRTLIDLTSDTVTADTLAEGVTAHDKSGAQITGKVKIKSWRQLQAKVRDNDMSDILISDQYSCNKGDATIDFDVIGKNQDTPASSLYTNTLTLKTHFQLPDTMRFDEKEAFYYCSSSLSAGTYYVSWDSSNYKFTLTKSVPAGGQLVFTGMYFISDISSYSSATSRTAIETVTASSGTGGTKLGTLKDDTKSGNLNSFFRAIRGNNNWKESNIRQWLNSDKPAGEWWQPQNKWDRPPDYADTMNGFLYDLDPDFLKVVGLTSKITVKTTSDGSGKYTTNDLFFLLSQTEVYGGQAVAGINEGQAYTFYSENSSLSAPGTGADTNRITYRDGSASWYWLRTPHTTGSDYGFYVDYQGAIRDYSAKKSGGVVLACNII